MNWRDISKVGVPLDTSKSYLVTDGKECSTTNIDVKTNCNTGEKTFLKWTGDENTYEYNECCSGERMFGLIPTHWIPTDEIPLP